MSRPEINTSGQSFTWKVKKSIVIGANNGNAEPPPISMSNEICDSIAANEITPKK